MPDSAQSAVTADQVDDLGRVLRLVRSGEATTRPELGRKSGLGRSVISQRVVNLNESGLVGEGPLGPSTAGRARREVKFCAEAGLLLAGSCAIRGIGVGPPGPVKSAAGRPISPPIMPWLDAYHIRGRLSARYVPVRVDDEVNLMTLGELRSGMGQGQRDMLYVKVGTGIGAGLVSSGLLRRGAQGWAGDIGYVATAEGLRVVCRCGNTGCLEVSAGAALARVAGAAWDGASASAESGPGRVRH